MPEVTGSGGSLASAFRAAIAQASLGGARPSYRLTGPAAQYRQLSRTRLGRQALEQAGVRPSAPTRRKWLGRVQRPSRANADAIRRAYGAMQRGGIPSWVKSGEMQVTGRTRTGLDDRDRTEQHPLKINLSHAKDTDPGRTSRGLLHYSASDKDPGETYWDHFERRFTEDLDDDELEDLISEDLIEPDIGSSDGWEFPGGAYTVALSG
jgi:hypothetical protein